MDQQQNRLTGPERRLELAPQKNLAVGRNATSTLRHRVKRARAKGLRRAAHAMERRWALERPS